MPFLCFVPENSAQEYLWVPCSLVQPLGDDAVSVEIIQGGLVTVLSVRVNINIKTETVEELLAKKKSMHVAAMRAMIDDLENYLKRVSETHAFKERARTDASICHLGASKIVDDILHECRAVLQRHEQRPALDFVDDNVHRCLVMQLLDCKSWAQEKLQLWLEDKAEYWEGRYGIKKETLVNSHRMWLALQRRTIARAASQSLAAKACTTFLQSQKLITQNVSEETFDNETIVQLAGASGWSHDSVMALKCAGGDLNLVHAKGWTALLYGELLARGLLARDIICQLLDMALPQPSRRLSTAKPTSVPAMIWTNLQSFWLPAAVLPRSLLSLLMPKQTQMIAIVATVGRA
jgi:hypothetical protein